MKRSNFTLLAMLVAVVIFFVMGLVKGSNARKLKAECTESVPGVITEVDSKLVRRRRSTHTEYRGKVAYTRKGDTNESTFKTEWTSVSLNEGMQTTVYYDPDNAENIYCDKVLPEGSVPSFITSGILLVAGLIGFVVMRAKGQ